MKRQRDDQMPSGGLKRPASVPRPAQAGVAMGHRLTTNDALTYLREVKNRFADKKEVYDTFLEIMKEFKAQRIDTAGVIVRVKELFKGHKQLVLGFNTFLPKGYEIQLADVADMDSDPGEGTMPGHQSAAPQKQPVEFDQAINYVNKIKTRFAQDERVYKAFLEILNMYRKGQKTISNVYDEVAVLFRQHTDLLTEFTYFLPDNSPPAGGAHPLLSRVGINTPWQPRKPGMPGGRMVMQGPGHRGYGPPGAYGPGSLAYNKRKTGRPEMGRGSEDDFGMRGPGGSLEKELMYFDRVKAKLRSKEAYQDFLKCLHLFATDIISRSELIQLASDVIGRYPDLVQGFNHFLSRCETMESFDVDLRNISNSVRLPKDMGRLKTGSARDRFFSKPISEVASEINPDDRCTTSYVRVPAGFPKLRCSGRSALHDEVLNDSWVSIISGSEDYSFKLMRKNQYEEALFRCEDDRYELDMCIETNASTIRKLLPLKELFDKMGAEERANYRLDENSLSPVHYRAIERIYGDAVSRGAAAQGPQIVELMKKNPTVAIPVILNRLEQKDAEWRKNREDMNVLWRKVFEQNYHKSLDHRSFYFKQADKKSLLPKAMMQEIKDAAETRRTDKNQLRALSLGCPMSAILQPDLVFDYMDSAVFEDVYNVVIYALEESLTAEVRDQVIGLWHDLVELFFGRGQRQYMPLHTKAELQEVHEAPKSSSSEQEEPTAKQEDGAESAGVTGGEGGVPLTPEPGTTPEPEDKGDALEALLAAGAKDLMDTEAEGEAGKAAARPEDMSTDAPGVKTEAEEAGDHGDSSDEHANKFYETCKPLSSRMNAAAAAVAASSTEDEAAVYKKQHILYGNDSFYLFFRFHQHVYNRMETAQRCAREKNQPQFRQTGEAGKGKDPEAAAVAREEAGKLHAEFMGMVHKLLDSQLDSSLFEDQCRTLLGTNSYVLFTLDKLIFKFVKHLQTMVVDEQTMRLVELHKYERARRAPLSDEVYRANANLVLHDDNCYRFEYVEDAVAAGASKADATGLVKQEHVASSSSSGGGTGQGDGSKEGGQLRIQLLEPDKTEQQPMGLDPMFSTYIKTYMCSGCGVNKDKVYLPRSVQRNRTMSVEDDPRLLEVLQGVCIANGLECKISCTNSKVSYVLDTEDVMYRRGSAKKSRKPFPTRTGVQHYKNWYKKQLAGLLESAPADKLRIAEMLVQEADQQQYRRQAAAAAAGAARAQLQAS